MNSKDEKGASAVYRGYRNQALYVLNRILTDSEAAKHIYRPESAEDLAIYDAGQNLVEVIQVKDHTAPLALSHLKPDSADGFFSRLLKRQATHPGCITKVASFGPLGPQLEGAINNIGNHRPKVIKKLQNLSGISETDCAYLLQSLSGEIVHPKLEQLKEATIQFLNETIAGADTATSLDLLTFWIFDASENQRDLTRAALLDKLQRIGGYLATLKDASSEWGSNVVPLVAFDPSEERSIILRREFRAGIQAQWAHIVAEADYPRLERLDAIHQLFQKHSCVIVRGASGQGKSSICWRYLRDYCAEGLRFHIRLVEGRKHALRIANALRAHVRRLELRPVVFLDLAPNDSGWLDLVRILSQAEIRVLVAAREEDFRRSGVVDGDFGHADLSLEGITKEEAAPIFESIHTARKSTPLDFEQAWALFTESGSGPLLEFTHLVTEGETLGSRISSQIQRLQQEASISANGLTIAHLDLLALAALANSSEARLDFRQLCDAVGLAELTGPLKLLEKEYCIRISSEGGRNIVGGLHALRSRAIIDALCDGSHTLVRELAERCLDLVVDEDLESFLRYVFLLNKDHSSFLAPSLTALSLRSWTQAGGIARALIAEGASAYERSNRSAIAGAIKNSHTGWSFACDPYIGFAGDEAEGLISSVSELFKGKLEMVSLTPKDRVFTLLDSWASEASPPPEPVLSSDWISAGDVAFWLGHRSIEAPIREALLELPPSVIPGEMGLMELAEFVSGLERLNSDTFHDWENEHRESLKSIFLRASDSFSIQDEGSELKIIYALPLAGAMTSAGNNINWNEETMSRVGVLRKILPKATHYGAQAVGPRAIAGLLGYDPSFKKIPVANLHHERSVQLNSTFQNIVSFRHLRPATWKNYAEELLAFREAVNDGFRKLYRAWVGLMAEPVPSKRAIAKIPTMDLEAIFRISRRIPPLPRVAVDEWGLASESSSSKKETKALQVLIRYDSWLKASRSFASGIREVVKNVNDFTATYLLARTSKSLDPDAADRGLLIVNLATAWEELAIVQLEFRKLFGQFSSEQSLARLDEYEKLNFQHLWSTAFGMQHFRDRSIRNANIAIGTKITERRKSFLDSLEREIGKIMGKEKYGIDCRTWKVNNQASLRIVCDHDSITDAENVRGKIADAIWSAAQRFEWRDHEWTPLTIDWHSFAIMHLIKGKLLEPTAVFIPSTAVFEKQPQHIPAIPVPRDCVVSIGITVWDQPLVRATISLEKALKMHLLNCARVSEILEFFSGSGLEVEQIEERLLGWKCPLSR